MPFADIIKSLEILLPRDLGLSRLGRPGHPLNCTCTLHTNARGTTSDSTFHTMLAKLLSEIPIHLSTSNSSSASSRFNVPSLRQPESDRLSQNRGLRPARA